MLFHNSSHHTQTSILCEIHKVVMLAVMLLLIQVIRQALMLPMHANSSTDYHMAARFIFTRYPDEVRIYILLTACMLTTMISSRVLFSVLVLINKNSYFQIFTLSQMLICIVYVLGGFREKSENHPKPKDNLHEFSNLRFLSF